MWHSPLLVVFSWFRHSSLSRTKPKKIKYRKIAASQHSFRDKKKRVENAL